MDKNVRLGDGVFDEVKVNANNRLKELAKKAVDKFFDYLEDSVNDLPETVKQLRNSPRAEQEITALWSEQLAENGIVPKGYNGLPDDLLISNFHQQGYLDGLYVGYALAMMALIDNNASKELIIAARDYIRSNLLGHHYDDRDEFINRYKDEKYSWVEKKQ